MTTFAKKVFSITDLVIEIGKWKSMFEYQWDIEKLNNTYLFQHLIGIVFYLGCDNGLVKYNEKIGNRMRIEVCKCNRNTTVVQFDLLKKYKKTPYYNDGILLNNNDKSLHNQRKLAEWILNDQLLLDFCKSDGEII